MDNVKNIDLSHDGHINISTGISRRDINWKNREVRWSKLLKRLSQTTITPETREEYDHLQKGEQDRIKDVGGFVGGTLNNQRRRRDTVESRSLITLDADYGVPELWDIVKTKLHCACSIYSTHKHRREKPRLRILIPLSKSISPEEYEAVARKVAETIGIEYFDPTTFEPSRLMYWPSTSIDGIYEFNYQDEEWLNPEDVLSQYEDWRNISSWPESSRAENQRKAAPGAHKNPGEKDGLIGAFCRTYSIQDAIEKYLNDLYHRAQGNDRYTYANGTTSGGLVVYEGGSFAYSFHATDPAGGRLLNAFDLVRIHRFGEMDIKKPEDSQTENLPSFNAMLELCEKDNEVKLTLGKERYMDITRDFGIENAAPEPGSMDWMSLLDLDKNGKVKVTTQNIVLILDNDIYLKEKIAHNEFSHKSMIRSSLPWHQVNSTEEDEPWTDSDDANLRIYLESGYGIVSQRKITDSFISIERKNSYHPIKEYLEGLVWDKTPRIETLFIDYLGAEDTPYTRTVTKKSLCAATARIFKPGIKFDYALVLLGKQGIGKSELIGLLGQKWYSDSFYTVLGKEAFEQLREAWIIEIPELSALKKAEAEAAKHFISKREDIYRVPYDKHPAKFPRQCVFFGTTNENEFLKSKNGNRKFWPLRVGVTEPVKDLWNKDMKSEIDQIWAEALETWRNGEPLFLNSEMEKEALRIQGIHTEENPKEGPIREYLELLLPDNWDSLDLTSRRSFIQGSEFGVRKGTVKRQRVCAMEIWAELFQVDIGKVTIGMAREINDILRNIDSWEQYKGGNSKLSFGKIYGNQRAFVRIEDENN